MPSRPSPRRSRLRRTLLVLLTVAVAAAAGYWLAVRTDDDGGTTAAGSSPVAAPTSAAPTTEAPVADGDPVASLEPERTGGSPIPTEPAGEVATDTPVPTEDAGEEVTPQLTYYGWVDGTFAVEVGAYVAGVVESNGSCTLTLTSGSDSRTAVVAGEADATTTSCPTMVVPGAQLSSGIWKAVVSYESPSSAGESAPIEVTVP
ncbi:hypothetical protein DQ239_02885 [Blastococcus sp. TF02-09]|uniref:hypothetical protein n=1 Tax=Blastococcus sp. TF02-09 TaxID=2250576 RepID=UPI000DE97F07|nr:hypothetical protein [Blastococcus sp. TF02-9]RBY80052.1 hypothetical protein DQ239_02885 [Blastococcus sp. TF02-9]